MEYFKNESEFFPDKLFAGTAVPPLMGFAEIEKGQGILKRGTLIGKGADGKFYVLGSSVAADSDEADIVPYGVLADEVDTADKNIDTSVYLTGIFNRSAVFVAEGADISDYEHEFRKLSIYFEDVIG